MAASSTSAPGARRACSSCTARAPPSRAARPSRASSRRASARSSARCSTSRAPSASSAGARRLRSPTDCARPGSGSRPDAEDSAGGCRTTPGVDAPLSPQELVRPWRTATLVASTLAAIELVLLLGGAVLLLAKPISHAVQSRAVASASSAPSKPEQKHTAPKLAKHARRTTAAAAAPTLSRAQTGVVVLNGNGRQGAAAAGAARVHSLGYRIAGTANARRQDYAATVVMYRTGFRAEAMRLAKDLKVHVVGPLDGLAPAALNGGQLAIVLGA